MALVAALGVALALLVPAGPAQAAEPPIGPHDPEPLTLAVGYLTSQIENGDGLLIHYGDTYYDKVVDVPLSMDAAEALDEIGGHDELVGRVVDAVVAELAGRPDDVLTPYERATYLAFLGPRVEDPRDVAGRDLVAEVEEVVGADGRIAAPPDYSRSGVTWQADAVRALRSVASPELAAARAYLVSMACPKGPYGALPPSGSQPVCTGRVNYYGTIAAAHALVPDTDRPEVARVVRNTATWLVGRQTADGAVENGSRIPEPVYGVESRHTGPATALWADVAAELDLPGLRPAIARGVSWVRSLQETTGVGRCRRPPSSTTGAIHQETVLDEEGAMIANTPRDLLYGTVDSILALQSAPGRSAEPRVLAPARRYLPGVYQAYPPPAFLVPGAAPGEELCVSFGGGTPHSRKVLQGGLLAYAETTVAWRIRVEDDGGLVGTTTVRRLGELRLEPRARERVRTGARQRVRVAGLAPYERVSVRRGAKVLVAGKADGLGRFRKSFPVGGKPGKVRMTVVGEFDFRSGRATYRIVGTRARQDD